jgi:hypothetical protein
LLEDVLPGWRLTDHTAGAIERLQLGRQRPDAAFELHRPLAGLGGALRFLGQTLVRQRQRHVVGYACCDEHIASGVLAGLQRGEAQRSEHLVLHANRHMQDRTGSSRSPNRS